MKILLTNYDMSVFGGTERMVTSLANLFREKHIDVTVFSFYRKNDSLPFPLNTQIQILFWKTQEKHLGSRIKILNKIYRRINKAIKIIERLILSYQIKQYDFDVIISNDYDVFIPYFKNKKTKYIKIAHGNFNTYQQCKGIGLFRDLVILSAREYQRWKNKYPKINIHAIPNFLSEIPLECSDFRQKTVLCAGRLSQGKGLDRLIDIWGGVKEDEQFKEWRLIIIGEGDYKDTLEKKIKEKSLQNSVILKPFTKEIGKEYLEASIYVMTSYFEGFPMVLLEASSCALPIISFDIISGPSDIIEHGKTGFLIENHNLREFENKLKTLMGDEDLRKTMGRQAKEKARREFNKEITYQKWRQIMQ